MQTNALYYGDNLGILRDFIPDESVDLIYLDPPFNSSQDYNVIFRDESGRRSDAQLFAFEDTLHWGPTAERTFAFLTGTAWHQGRVSSSVSTLIAALRRGIGENQMLAYLVEMTVRLVELHRVLKPTGNLYLHCDPAASHYLKIILDAIFDAPNFRNEIIWRRTGAKGLTSRRLAQNHDVILAYQKSGAASWNEDQAFLPYDASALPDKTDEKYSGRDSDGRRYQLTSLLNPNPNRPNLTYEFLGVTRVWRWTKERMQAAHAAGMVVQPKPGGVPRFKRYLDKQRGLPLNDVWADIAPINARASERLGYPTQKPLALLERILKLSSRPGDVILDPYCGCGTAVVAAHALGRRWIGIDITILAVNIMRARLKDAGLGDVPVIGQPTEVDGARQLAQMTDGRYQFQWWALGMVDARPLGGVKKKGADRGIDGVIRFPSSLGKLETVIVSVKSGKVNSGMVRDLRGVIERDDAAMGVFLTLEEPSREMLLEATKAGLYTDPKGNRFDRLQILSIRELLKEGKRPALPTYALPPYPVASRIPVAVNVEQESFLDSDGHPIVRRPEDSASPAQAAAAPSQARTRRKRTATG